MEKLHKVKRSFLLKSYKILVIFLIALIFSLFSEKKVQASSDLSYTDDIDYTEIQNVIDDVLDQGNTLNFGDYVNKLMNGEEAFSLSGIGKKLLQSIKNEFSSNLKTLGRLITIAIIAAIFTNLSMAFKNSQVSETGYYVTYLLLFGILISSFIAASAIAASTLRSILDFMKALVPSYFISIGFCNGAGTSFVYYEAALVLISIVDFVLIRIVIPLIDFYLVIMLVNNLSKEDMLSKLADLISTIVSWLLKSLLAAVIGYQAIQGLIVPVADRVKRSALLKASESIPGIGNTVGGLTETILGAGVLLKNAIGVAGLVSIIVICAIPLVKLVVVTLIYKCSSAVLQPISDKRIIECVGASAQSSGLLLQTVFVGAVLFLITITIVAVTTGGLV